MYTPHRDKRSGGGRGSHGFGQKTGSWKKPRGGRDFGNSESFEAICGACGKNCRVPFRPNGKKPVLCTNCFKKEGGRGDFGNGPKNYSNSTERDDRAIQEQLRTINAKLDAILEAIGGADEDA